MPKDEPFKNYYQNIERKFTVFHLEIRKLDLLDIISIVVFAVAVFIDFFLITESKNKFISSLLISWSNAFFILTTPFGLRFRNLYFSVAWLVLSLCFLSNSFPFNKLPILLFILYHGIRLVFWNNYNKEFIPYHILRGEFKRFVSKNEGRGGYKEDKNYMKIMACLGFMMTMYCLFEMVGRKI